MVCRYCGSEFEPKKRGRKNTGFCCKHCADNWRQHNVYDLQPPKYTKKCERCGVEFQTNQKGQKFCSQKCSHNARSKKEEIIYEKVCPYCGVEFKTHNKKVRYCSSACGSRAQADRVRGEYFCEYCGKPRHSDHPNRNRYCSRSCATKAITYGTLEHELEIKKQKSRPKTVERKKCLECGKEFIPSTSNQLYCCHDCSYSATLRNRREEQAKRYEPHTITCTWCGQPYEVAFGDGRRVYCSDTCQKQAARYKFKSQRKQQMRAAFIESVGVRKIFQRDEGMCQICGLPVPATTEPSNQWAATRDHIIPISKGGKHCMKNCQLAHRICNSMKHDTLDRFVIDWEAKLDEEPGRWEEQLADLYDQIGE